MNDAEFKEIMELITKAYEKAGKKLETATLYKGNDEPELVLDNREEKDIH